LHRLCQPPTEPLVGRDRGQVPPALGLVGEPVPDRVPRVRVRVRDRDPGREAHVEQVEVDGRALAAQDDRHAVGDQPGRQPPSEPWYAVQNGAGARRIAGAARRSLSTGPSAGTCASPLALARRRRSVCIPAYGGNPPSVRSTHSLRKRSYAAAGSHRAARSFACGDSALAVSAPASANSRNTAWVRSSSIARPYERSASRARPNIVAAYDGLSAARNARPA